MNELDAQTRIRDCNEPYMCTHCEETLAEFSLCWVYIIAVHSPELAKMNLYANFSFSSLHY